MIKKNFLKNLSKTPLNRYFSTLASNLQNNWSLIEKSSDAQIVKLKK
ncbi:ribosomal protein S17E [Chryseobacterium sediminis]|nr:ribosomal protein S17E [Chryseobacterium sediminis]